MNVQSFALERDKRISSHLKYLIQQKLQKTPVWNNSCTIPKV